MALSEGVFLDNPDPSDLGAWNKSFLQPSPDRLLRPVQDGGDFSGRVGLHFRSSLRVGALGPQYLDTPGRARLTWVEHPR